jgi:GT2 family glycosyltransferase
MTITLNMIVGPYPEPFLKPAIASCYKLCDEFVFVDTAPGNNPNRAILDEFKELEDYDIATVGEGKPVKIIDMPRGEDKEFSFSAARELARVNTDKEWVLRLDADEVLHEKDIDQLRALTRESRYNNIEVAFYHFMVYPWLYQYIEPKCILMRTKTFSWVNGVHEVQRLTGKTCKAHDIKYFHYGYCRGQEEVFKRWQLYVEIDGRPTWYNGVDSSNILTDRISVCQNFKGEHPKVVQPVLAEMFQDVPPFQVQEITRYKMTDNYVGLLLITKNDEENLRKMLSTLEETINYPTYICVADMCSTDDSPLVFIDWFESQSNPYIYDAVVLYRPEDESLTKTMNAGFRHIMSRQECNYIGWIHPDMEFREASWLSELIDVLQAHPEIGKVCSYNTRDSWPMSEDLMEGQEQCYLIRRGILFKIGLFDEAFIGIGGYEDWDMNNRIKQEGFKVVIVPRSKVWHKGMATRERMDTTTEQIYNSEIYKKKWLSSKENAV